MQIDFQRPLIHFQQVTLDGKYWQTLKLLFMQTADDTSDPSWDNVSRIFSDKNSSF